MKTNLFTALFFTFFTLLNNPFPGAAESQDAKPAGNTSRPGQSVHKIEVKVGEDDSAAGLYQNTPDDDPFAEIRSLQARMQKLFQDNVMDFSRQAAPDSLFSNLPFEPPANVEDRGDALHITLDIPGMSKEDIKLTLKNNVLTVSGKREGVSEESKEEQGRRVYTQERFSGGFRRNIQLPVPVKEDSIKAKYEQGVLSISALKVKNVLEEGQRIPVE